MASSDNTAIYTILPIYLFLMVCISGFSFIKNTVSGTILKLGSFEVAGQKVEKETQSFLGAGNGLSGFVLFFTMAASLFSGYSISGIANEANTFGFLALRWIPAGVALYGAFMFLAPRLHALGKSRGYLTIGEFIFDRYAEPASSPIIPHSLRILTLFCQLLPVFTYLISQFTALGTEVEIYTKGEVSKLAALLVAAAVLLFCSLLGGLRAVAYNDVLQGVLLLIGSIVFFIIQQTEFGGMGEVKDYVRSDDFLEANPFGYGKFNNVPNRDKGWSTSSYASFILKVMLAATMFPHLVMRLFIAQDSQALKLGLGGMNFTFFIVQLSSMVTGWVAVAVLSAEDNATFGTFGAVANEVRSTGGGGQFASAMLLTAAVCAMVSTADSSLIAFSTMMLRDLYLPYFNPSASQRTQVIFTRVLAILGLALGVFLGIMSIEAEPEPWNLSNLFSLQTVTPIHVVPGAWLGLHWKGLRGEPVLAGMLVGLGVTFGFTFSDLNVKLSLGLDETKEGWSPALIGFCFNLIVTVIGGIFCQSPSLGLPAGPLAQYARPLDLERLFGPTRDSFLHPAVVFIFALLTALTVPFYMADEWGKPDEWVGNITLWAFLSLLFSGLLAFFVAGAYYFLWTDYTLPKEPPLYPEADSQGNAVDTPMTRMVAQPEHKEAVVMSSPREANVAPFSPDTGAPFSQETGFAPVYLPTQAPPYPDPYSNQGAYAAGPAYDPYSSQGPYMSPRPVLDPYGMPQQLAPPHPTQSVGALLVHPQAAPLAGYGLTGLA
mmetsp:Transcript_16719/g.40010  ORF Transcript_16719/g.40010 Transcript_16719/m.40010 type:complete len:772 (+) Transcript_16719:76-2391(+)